MSNYPTNDFYYIPEVSKRITAIADSGQTIFHKSELIELFGEQWGNEFIERMLDGDFAFESVEESAIFLRKIGVSFLQTLKTEYSKNKSLEVEFCASVNCLLSALSQEMKNSKPDVDAVMNSIDMTFDNEDVLKTLRKSIEDVFKSRDAFLRNVLYNE